MLPSRRAVLATLVALLMMSCGSATSRLVTVRSATGGGGVEFEVRNHTDVPINNLYMAKSEIVANAEGDRRDPTTPAYQEMWGADLLDGALEPGGKQSLSGVPAGTWDLRAVDRDGRYQHIAALKLASGGRYILELNDGSWRVTP
jgi:hypothetical protein